MHDDREVATEDPLALDDAIRLLRSSVREWNALRKAHPDWIPHLSRARSAINAEPEKALEGPDLAGLDLRNANLSKAWMIKANLRGSQLMGADIREAFLMNADFSGADLSKSTAWTMIAPRADFRDAVLREAHLENSILYEARFDRADLSKANLRGVHFSNIFANGAVLRETNLVDAVLSEEGTHEFPMLAGADGLETARFGSSFSIADYLHRVLEHLHAAPMTTFEQGILRKVRSLQALYLDDRLTTPLLADLQTVTSELLQHLAQNPRALHSLSPRRFEEIVAELLASFGWDVQLTAQTRDGGYDIFAVSKDASGLRTSWIVECKKWSTTQKVGIDVVRGLYAVKQDLRVGNALLATTSHFTRGVYDAKASRYDLELKDFEGLVEWINQYHPLADGKLYINQSRLVVR